MVLVTDGEGERRASKLRGSFTKASELSIFYEIVIIRLSINILFLEGVVKVISYLLTFLRHSIKKSAIKLYFGF